MLEKFLLPVESARLVQDPNFNHEHGTAKHIFTVSAKRIPHGIGFEPNARQPKIQKRVYKKVINSLLQKDESAPGTFHLKNKGITIIANSVRQSGADLYEIELESSQHGIIDGGHTYEIITKHQDDPDLPDNQYVNVEVRVGIPDIWISDIAGGLNTTVQVQDMSLDDLAGKFEWLKSEIRGEPYYNRIAWSENDTHDHDARDIISMLLCFNIVLYPNDGDKHPLEAYSRKASALQQFENTPQSFERMRPILKDILKFHDIVSKEGRDLYNRDTDGSAGNLAFVEKRSTKQSANGEYEFIFTKKTATHRLVTGALYPMMAAFRWYVQEDSESKNMSDMKWDGGFERVLDAWHDIGSNLMKATHNTSNELGRNPQSVGKSKNHWSNLHTLVGFKKLRSD